MSNLMRITYVSRSTFKPFNANLGIEPHVARILSESRRNNMGRHLVGVLYYGNGCFFQCLEGEKDDIDRLYAALEKDPRHRDLKVLSQHPIDYVTFIDWNMKYVSVDPEVQALLKKHGMARFDPYQFDANLIQEMVDIFHRLPEPANPTTVEKIAEDTPKLLEQQVQAARKKMDRVVAVAISSLAVLGGAFLFHLAA
jgi:hypothetical protein